MSLDVFRRQLFLVPRESSRLHFVFDFFLFLCLSVFFLWFLILWFSCNITVVGVYIPQKSRTSPDQKSTYDKLEKLLQALSKQRDAIILMGDFNSRLKRNITGYTGRWCIHNRSDEGGERLLEIMRKFGLACSSTYFQPKKRHSNATFMNVQPGKPPSQIDYIFVSQRWASSVRSCATKWGLPMQAYGRKYDHAMVLMKFKGWKVNLEEKEETSKRWKTQKYQKHMTASLRKHLPNLKFQPVLMKSGRDWTNAWQLHRNQYQWQRRSRSTDGTLVRKHCCM